jgi:hypothetical protein
MSNPNTPNVVNLKGEGILGLGMIKTKITLSFALDGFSILFLV